MTSDSSEHLPLAMVNGVCDSRINIFDRGVQFGDGFFETLLWTQGRAPLKALHWQRLQASAERLKIALKLEQLESYFNEFERRLRQRAGDGRFAIKIIISRGGGGRGYVPSNCAEPNVIISERKLAPTGPIRLQLCQMRLGENPAIAGIKHLDKLEYALAGLEIGEGMEGLLLSASGFVAEAMHYNIFWVHNGRFLTPRLSTCGVHGVMRRYLLEVALPALQFDWQLQDAELETLYRADEVFVCNAVRGIQPVRSLGEKLWETGHFTSQVKGFVNREFTHAFF